MGSIYSRGKTIWFRIKNRAGKWKSVRSDFTVGDEAAALKGLRAAEDRVAAEAAVDPSDQGPLTLRKYATRWLEGRKVEIETWKNDESRLRLYVFPEIGDSLMADVRPRHVRDLIKKLRQRKRRRGSAKLAPRTIYNTYALLSALFRDAAVDGIVEHSPCILRSSHLGPKVDADPYWRNGAHYSRSELESLVGDARLDLDHRVLWALMGIGGLRPGEAFGLRIRELNWDLVPLAAMFIATSHGRGRTKTSVSRPVPIHPALALLLREWLASGWEATMGRAPSPNELLIPLPASSKGDAGRMRTNSRTLKTLHDDLELLGFRKRRVQDLRHTMISLSRTDGAHKDILRRATHQPPKEVIEGYTHFEWDVVCREVIKLKLESAVNVPPTPTDTEDVDECVPVVSDGYDAVSEILATSLATLTLQNGKSPVNPKVYEASFQRGVGDLNP